MINPYDLNQPWDRRRLEEWILFSICVCNKPADATAKKVEEFLYGDKSVPKELTPFQRVKYFAIRGRLTARMRKVKFGQYTRIQRAMLDVLKKVKDPLKTTVAELESVHGIGPKSARMIMLYYKPETECAPLDTHVLKWLRLQGYDAPKGTPSGKKYLELEQAFIAEAKKRKMTVKELDTHVWQSYALRPADTVKAASV